MNSIRIDGEVAKASELSVAQLREIDVSYQVADVRELGARRGGQGVRLQGLLSHVEASPEVKFIGLHASKDDFHACVPIEPIRESAILVYSRDGAPLDAAVDGPYRFFIPNHSACHTDEIDECANVKFVDHIELTVERGFDNRPKDDEEHDRLHAR